MVAIDVLLVPLYLHRVRPLHLQRALVVVLAAAGHVRRTGPRIHLHTTRSVIIFSFCCRRSEGRPTNATRHHEFCVAAVLLSTTLARCCDLFCLDLRTSGFLYRYRGAGSNSVNCKLICYIVTHKMGKTPGSQTDVIVYLRLIRAPVCCGAEAVCDIAFDGRVFLYLWIAKRTVSFADFAEYVFAQLGVTKQFIYRS